MKLFEYQGQKLLESYHIPVPWGMLCHSPEEAEDAASGIGGRVVVKAQVLTGGRGKAGGIKLADNPAAARKAAKSRHTRRDNE